MTVIRQVRVKGQFKDYGDYRADRKPKNWHAFADGDTVDVVEIYEDGAIEAVGTMRFSITKCRGPQTLQVGQFEEI